MARTTLHITGQKQGGLKFETGYFGRSSCPIFKGLPVPVYAFPNETYEISQLSNHIDS
jgi:hypothetical protein